MTKREAIDEFNEMYGPDAFYPMPNYKLDKPMRAEAWNNFTDALCKDKRITRKQYDTWTHPWRD